MIDCVIGVDPGFSGAICVFEMGEPVEIFDMPVLKIGKRTVLDDVEVREIFFPYHPVDLIKQMTHVYLEKAQTRPDQGVVSSGNYMKAYGQVMGIVCGLGISYTEVHPRTWKAKMMWDMPKDKGASIVRCKQIFPEFAKEHLTLKKHHGRADAALLCAWAIKYGHGHD